MILVLVVLERLIHADVVGRVYIQNCIAMSLVNMYAQDPSVMRIWAGPESGPTKQVGQAVINSEAY